MLKHTGAAFGLLILPGCKRHNSGKTAQYNPNGEDAITFVRKLPPATQPCIDVVVRPWVVPIKQPSNNTCWAAVWTMMASWRKGQRFTIEAAVKELGSDWMNHLKRDEGLEAQTFTEQSFLQASGLKSKPPANYLPSAYVELLASHGPLWVNTGDGILNHATLLVAAHTRDDGQIDFQFADPKLGDFITKSDAVFFKEFEDEARFIVDRHLNWDLRFQIFYW